LAFNRKVRAFHDEEQRRRMFISRALWPAQAPGGRVQAAAV